MTFGQSVPSASRNSQRTGAPQAGQGASLTPPAAGPNITAIDRIGDQDGGGDQEDCPGLEQAAQDGGEKQGTGHVDQVQFLSGVQAVLLAVSVGISRTSVGSVP